jgi:hypothetical protein
LAASSGYLQLLGFQAIAHARKAGRGHALVPLLIRKALTSLGRLDLWGVTARRRQLHTDNLKVLHGTIKTAVVGRQRYKGTEVNTLDCINIKRNKDWEEATTFPDAARITTIKGTIGYIAADDHLKGSSCNASLVDSTAQCHFDDEIGDGEGASTTNMSCTSTSRCMDT